MNNNEKSIKLRILERMLKFMAKKVIKKYRPKIIGITGSVGKTSTKEAIYCVLEHKFILKRSEKNYNNEIGLPLAVIGSEAAGKSIFGWVEVFSRWLKVMFFLEDYPEVVVLEMGADRPGDIAYLTSIAKPNIAVLTDVSSSHLEFFKNIESVSKEKSNLIKNLNKDGLAVLNIDNEHIKKFKDRTENSKKDSNLKILGYGFSEAADVRATEVFTNYDGMSNEVKGITFKLEYQGTTIPVRLNNIIAEHNIYSALAAVAVGVELGLNLVEIGQSLENFALPKSRMALISGIKNSMIIDDTYNASPISTVSALSIFGKVAAKRKIAVLGDMLELGPDTEPGHKRIAQEFIKIGGDIFIGVGRRMESAIAELASHNMERERIYHFQNPTDAGRMLQEIMKEGDLILIKGSQGMRMEKIVEEVMAHPEEAERLLCRQDESWKIRPWKEV